MSGTTRLLSNSLLCCPKVHATRFRAVGWAVASLVKGARLSVTGIGRTRGETSPKHAIKRSDRLIGNEKLLGDHEAYFEALVHSVIPKTGPVVVLVDWTKIGSGHYALVVAMQHSGRSIPLRFELHPLRNHGTPKIEDAFLRKLRKLLPNREVIVVTDAGFRTDWFKSCEALGFGYVGRLTGYAGVGTEHGWAKGRDLAKAAGAKAKDLGTVRVTKIRMHSARVVVAAKPKPTGRPPEGSRRPNAKAAKKARRQAKEAWVLVTNLDCSASQVLRLYGLRMQIEESFRDAKSPRFGRSLRYSRSQGATRLSNLLLLDMLAAFVLMLVGRRAERMCLHRRFQANTLKSRRVLSHATLGLAVLATNLRRFFAPKDLRSEAHRLRQLNFRGDS